jgi:uncharacterized membrane protein (UPF0127 family)
MRFPIDVVGLSREGRVVTCRAQVPRRRVVLALRAWAIVELPVGTIAKWQLQPGDGLHVVALEDRQRRGR